MIRKLSKIAGSLGIFLWACAPAVAQSKSTPPVFSAAQAARGEVAYLHNCRTCHGDNLDDGDFGGAPLRGSWFAGHWGVGDVASFFAYTKTNMPPDNPGGLNDETYADIVAYLLSRNAYQPGDKDLPADEKAQRAMTLRR